MPLPREAGYGVRTVRYPGRFSTRLPQIPEAARARNIVLCERAGDTNTQDNCDQALQPIRCPVHSHPPAVASNLPERERTPSWSAAAMARPKPTAIHPRPSGRSYHRPARTSPARSAVSVRAALARSNRSTAAWSSPDPANPRNAQVKSLFGGDARAAMAGHRSHSVRRHAGPGGRDGYRCRAQCQVRGWGSRHMRQMVGPWPSACSSPMTRKPLRSYSGRLRSLEDSR
jgi:hypothetical protein